MTPAKFFEKVNEYYENDLKLEEKTWHEDGHKYTKIIQLHHESQQLTPPYDQKFREINFKDNMLDGIIAVWSNEGIKLWEDNYKDGELHGPCRDWYEDGKIISEVNYEHGKRHGLAIGWTEDGNKEIEEHYNNGNVIRRLLYENGELIEDLKSTDSEQLEPDFLELRDKSRYFWG